MHKLSPVASAVSLVLAAGMGTALAAPPDWSKVPAKKIVVFYPGVTPIEWITKGGDHSGARGLKKGESCVSCHEEELADVGKKIASGEKLEPKPIKGKAGSVPVNVQAANDGTNLYLRFEWKSPAGGGPKMDKDSQVKLAVMLDDGKVEQANLSGCWVACHQDARTMPNQKSDDQTKYVKDGSVSGKFYDLIQWKSAKGAKPADGYVADKRVMEGGKALVSAEGKHSGDTWTVVFTRKLAGGGDGDINLQSGKTYNMGFAIHEDYTSGRFHYVSMGYTLGIDAKADITAGK
jgi:hypothetical protein